MELEQAIEYFSIFGGIGQYVDVGYHDDVFSMVESNFVDNFARYQKLISPSYLLESPYRELLMAVARGDGKLYSVIRKAKLSQSIGEKIVNELLSLGILNIEYSRETPLRTHPKHKLPREQRSYKIQDKLRFVQPFMRFWFAFVAYFRDDLLNKEGKSFLENFEKHYESLRSLVYEQLSNDLLIKYCEKRSPILSSGSYWDIYNEFDILAITVKNKIILGECKYKDRSVCKNELTKLKLKAKESGIRVDIYALFSKSGFSKELLAQKSDNLLLFDLSALNFLIQK